MKALAAVECEQLGHVIIARVTGEVDLSNVEEVSVALTDAVAQNASSLLLDLTATTYLDSTGVRLVFELAERLHARRQELRLVVSDTAVVRRVLVLTHVGEQVPFHSSIDDALAALED